MAAGLYGRAMGTGPPWDGLGWNWEAGISKMSEPVDEVDAALYRELDDIDGTLKGRCRGSVLPLAAELCDGLEAAEYCDGSLVV